MTDFRALLTFRVAVRVLEEGYTDGREGAEPHPNGRGRDMGWVYGCGYRQGLAVRRCP